MKVTLEIGALLEKLTEFNPEVDLTGVKAYLFDLLLEGGEIVKTTPSSPRRKTAAVKAPAPTPVVGPETEPETFDLEGVMEGEPDLIDQVLGAPSPAQAPTTRRSAPIPEAAASSSSSRGKKDPLAEKAKREAKRKEIADFSKMSGREVMEFLTAQKAPRKREGQNQFIDEGGFDNGPRGGGDLEIG